METSIGEGKYDSQTGEKAKRNYFIIFHWSWQYTDNNEEGFVENYNRLNLEGMWYYKNKTKTNKHTI